jgi:hypothetical protein
MAEQFKERVLMQITYDELITSLSCLLADIKKNVDQITQIYFYDNKLMEVIGSDYCREKIILDIILLHNRLQIPMIEDLDFRTETSKSLYAVEFVSEGKRNLIEVHL